MKVELSTQMNYYFPLYMLYVSYIINLSNDAAGVGEVNSWINVACQDSNTSMFI